jgi:hypothetical protein
MTENTTRRVRTATPTSISEDLQGLARAVFKANKEKNAATRVETESRKTLYKEMKNAGIKQFTTVAVVDGKRVTLEADIDAPTRVEIDVRVLRKLVDEETFLSIVSATQSSIKEHAGEAVMRRCATTTEGTENVTVKAAK